MKLFGKQDKVELPPVELPSSDIEVFGQEVADALSDIADWEVFTASCIGLTLLYFVGI